MASESADVRALDMLYKGRFMERRLQPSIA
jgi:hypothetical protein